MNADFQLSTIQCIERFAKAGLIHAKRNCSFCLAPMKVIKTPGQNYPVGYCWVCTQCFDKKSIAGDTPLKFVNIKSFHISLHLFVLCCKPFVAKAMCRNAIAHNYTLFRRAASHYMAKYIQPYLKFPSIMEVDETFIGSTRFSMLGTCDGSLGCTADRQSSLVCTI